MENPQTGERLNAENEDARAIERGADAARGNPDDWDDCYWGREVVVGFGNPRRGGFIMLPILQGANPALVKDVFLMHRFFGDDAEIKAKFEQLRAFHVGKAAGLLAFVSDDIEEESDASSPTPAAAEARRESEAEWQMLDEQRESREFFKTG